jgi:hypothetical protein
MINLNFHFIWKGKKATGVKIAAAKKEAICVPKQ